MPRDLIIIVFLLLLLTANLGWSQTLKRQELSRPYMGTIFQIIALGKGEKQVADAIEAAFQEIERLQNLLSLYKKNSRLNQVNQQAHLGPVKVV